MSDDNKPQPVRKVTGSANYFPDSQSTILTDSNNRERVIRNVTQDEYNKISAEFLANTLTSSTSASKSTELSRSLAASDLSSLMGAGFQKQMKTRKRN